MTTSDTRNTTETVKQILDLERVGCEIVRLTVPSQLDAENLPNIREELRKANSKVPLVADIHFTPTVAMMVVDYVEKIRINPGNFADKKKFAVLEYTDKEYNLELERIEEVFSPLVVKCKERGLAMRIGTNHGSLSDRIMNRYGDTPLGMVESALEFLRIAESHSYKDIVLSMKASNPQVMIQAYRLLVSRMDELKMDYPLHLGVTEAGDGKDGRIKSAIGIGSLLEDGLGDTVRVSLTEDAIHEIPVAKKLVEKYNSKWIEKSIPDQEIVYLKDNYREFRNPFQYQKLYSKPIEGRKISLGEDHPVRVRISYQWKGVSSAQSELENLTKEAKLKSLDLEVIHISLEDIQNLEEISVFARNASFAFSIEPKELPKGSLAHLYAAFRPFSILTLSQSDDEDILRLAQDFSSKGGIVEWVLSSTNADSVNPFLNTLDQWKIQNLVFSFLSDSENLTHNYRKVVSLLEYREEPIILRGKFFDLEKAMYEASIGLGSLLTDGVADCIHIEIQSDESLFSLLELSYDILQATRLRVVKAEYISCPSCGRTLFDLQETTARIKKKTGHLIGVKIAVMGCIVNGPGEMADADFGYVGAGVGKVHLYKGKEIIKKGVPSEEADERLVDLIKEYGMWNDPI
jgi:(E)-4-hydroxy-3-methylbut-2-enyl-diphosphate synthase